MASAFDLVLQNFVYRVEAIDPTSALCRRKFRSNDSAVTVSPSTSAGMVRSFNVFWESSEPAEEVEDIVERISDSEWTLEVFYPLDSARGTLELQRLIMQDRHDLIKALRTSDNFDGTSPNTPTTETDLHRRSFVGDDIEQGDQTWTYRQRWSCTVFESE